MLIAIRYYKHWLLRLISVCMLVLACTAYGQGAVDFGAASKAGSAAAGLRVDAIPSFTQVIPGQSFHVAVMVQIPKGYAYYSPNPGKSDDFFPLAAAVDVQSKFQNGQALWPGDKSHHYTIGGTRYVNNVYEGDIYIFVPVTAPRDLPKGQYKISVAPTGQICSNEVCIPVEKISASAHVTAGQEAVKNPQWTSQLDDALKQAKPAGELISASGAAPKNESENTIAQYSVFAGLGLALVAGLILNIMPCVLPVIPLKVLGIIQQAKESRRRFVTLGLAFAGGIVLFFVGIAVINVIFKVALSSAFQWGEHFQMPPFRIGMSLLMVVLGANLFGVYNVLPPRRLAQMEGKGRGQGHGSAVAMGILTGVLSTPCSFAILTAAIAWAQSLPIWLGMVAIITIGIGMALPYALLTAFPQALKRMPRPGAWMEHLKQAMGFLLLLVAIWLISTGSQDSYPFWVAAFGVVLVFSLWMWGTCVTFETPRVKKIWIRIAALAIALGAAGVMLPPPSPPAVKFQAFDQAAIDQARKNGRVVLVDFTASWCLTCKAVEALVYNDPEIAAYLIDNNVLAIKGDVTNRYLPANAAKEQLGEAIPVTVIYPPSGEPVRLRGIFSKADLINTIQKARAK